MPVKEGAVGKPLTMARLWLAIAVGEAERGKRRYPLVELSWEREYARRCPVTCVFLPVSLG